MFLSKHLNSPNFYENNKVSINKQIKTSAKPNSIKLVKNSSTAKSKLKEGFFSNYKRLIIYNQTSYKVSETSVNLISMKYVGELRTGIVRWNYGYRLELILPEHIYCKITPKYYSRFEQELSIVCKNTLLRRSPRFRRYIIYVGVNSEQKRVNLNYYKFNKTIKRG